MTRSDHSSQAAPAEVSPSPLALPFDPLQMARLRVRPATFSRLAGVSRESVSRWIEKGWIVVGSDGLLDPVVAFRQLIERSDPRHLRVRLLKQACAHHSEMLETIAALRREVDELRAESRRQRFAWDDEHAVRVSSFMVAIEQHWTWLCREHAAGQLQDALDRLVGRVIHCFDDEAMADTYGPRDPTLSPDEPLAW